MVAPVKPQKKTTFGRDAWGFAPLIADLMAPTLAELEATSGINLACFLLAEQEGVTGTTEKVQLARFLCETTTGEYTGATAFSMADLVSAFDPQAEPGSPGKKSWETLEDNLEGFMWRRLAVPATEELKVDQFVDIIPVQLGVKITGKSSADAGGIATFMQSVAVTGTPVFNVPIVAGA